jgi:hypothetical protein
MSTTRVSKFTMQMVAVSTLFAMSAGVASAQKVKAAGPPATTHGQTKANEAAAKGQATAEAERIDAAEDKAAKTAEKKEDAAERASTKAARSEPTELLEGIKLSKTEEKSVDGIEKKYESQLKDLEKQQTAAEKSGAPDASIASKSDALRMQERTELRGVLTPAQISQFDKNASTLGTKH